MIYFDTHVVVWLYEGLIDQFSKHVNQLIEKNDLFVSPIVMLELTYLHEIKKINCSASTMIQELKSSIGLNICDLSFEEIINKAISLTFTRDPFDRLILSHAMCNTSKLITKDRIIRKNYKLAVWD